jgi:hypothetical protein
VTGTLAHNDQALAALLTHLGNVMGDFDATLNGNEQNFRTTIITLDPLLTQLNGTLGIVSADTHSAIAAINTNNRVLQPELVSAVSQTDAAGNHLLRQYFVVNPACDQVNATPNPQCQSGTAQAPSSSAAAPALPSLPSLPRLPLPKCIPTPSPPAKPTPTLSPLPCPSISPPVLPSLPCMPAAPTPPKLPLPTPSPSLCPSLPGVSLPALGVLPDWLILLLFSGTP